MMITHQVVDIRRENYDETRHFASYRFRHCPILLKLFAEQEEKGRGIWRINHSLLKDDALTDKIRKDKSKLSPLGQLFC